MIGLAMLVAAGVAFGGWHWCRHESKAAEQRLLRQLRSTTTAPEAFDFVEWAKERSQTALPDISSWAPSRLRQWQVAKRREFKARFLFPTTGDVAFVNAGSPVEKDGYLRQEIHATLGGKRLFRAFRLVPHIPGNSQLPTLLVFMGHGKVAQLLERRETYQRAAADSFVKAGYLVYVMENVAMGPRDPYTAHLSLDNMLSLHGLSWYSVLFTSQLYLLDHVLQDPRVDSRALGAAGVSTGGLLALTLAALDERVAAASVQGIFAGLNDSFVEDAAIHCHCGTIDGLVPEFDLPVLASLVAPRPLQITINEADSFRAEHAQRAVEVVKPFFQKLDVAAPVLQEPPGQHGFAVGAAKTFFERTLGH